MNYCSLEDAWGGKCNQISNQYSNYMVDKNYTQPQPADIIKKKDLALDFNVENFNNTQPNIISKQNKWNNKKVKN